LKRKENTIANEGLNGKSLTYEEIDALIESSYDGLYITDGNANTPRGSILSRRITASSSPSGR